MNTETTTEQPPTRLEQMHRTFEQQHDEATWARREARWAMADAGRLAFTPTAATRPGPPTCATYNTAAATAAAAPPAGMDADDLARTWHLGWDDAADSYGHALRHAQVQAALQGRPAPTGALGW